MASVAWYSNGLSCLSQTEYKLLYSPASNRHRWHYCIECLKVLCLDRCSSTFILLMSSALPSHLMSAFIATLMTFSCMSVALLLTHLLLWPVYLRAWQQLAKIAITPFTLHDGIVITLSTQVRSLDVILDNKLIMTAHVSSVVRACFYQLRQIRCIRSSLTDTAATTLVHTLISSKLDYCNSVLYGTTAAVSHRLQAVLNASARIITGRRLYEHITPVLRDELHWLPIQHRIKYKIALLAFKCFHGISPVYLRDYCTPLASNEDYRALHSVTHGDIAHPRTHTRRIGPRSFRLAALAKWNSLSTSLKNSLLTLEQFKNLLKSHLFNAAYNC